MKPCGFERLRRSAGETSVTGAGAVLAIGLLLLAALAPARASAGPVTQAQWAHLLVQAMGLGPAIDPTGKDDATVIAFLTGGPVPATRVRAVASEPIPSGAQRWPAGAPEARAGIRAGAQALTLRYAVRVTEPGIYALRFAGAGEAQRWRIDDGEPRLAQPAGRLDAAGGDDREGNLLGYFLLAAGAHEVRVTLPPGGVLWRFELLRQPFPHIRPPGGWRPGAPLTFGDKAVTMIQAMQLEHELPDVARWRLQREGERYDADPVPVLQTNEGTREKPSAGLLVRGGADGSQVRYRLDVPRPGTYTLLARVTGSAGGRLRLNDAVERAWPPTRPADRLVWDDLATLPLAAGSQDLEVNLAAGAGLDVLRLVYRDPSPEAALLLLQDLGFEESSAEESVDMAAARANLDDERFRERVNTLVAGFYTQSGPGVGPGPGGVVTESPGLVLPDISP